MNSYDQGGSDAEHTRRRQFLAAMGTLGTFGAAGCFGDGDGETTSPGTETRGATETGTKTNTPDSRPTEDPYALDIREADGTVVWARNDDPVPLVRPALHVYTDTWGSLLAAQDDPVDTTVRENTVVVVYSMSGTYGDGSTLTVRYELSDGDLVVTWQADMPQEAVDEMGDKTRLVFSYSGEQPLPEPLSVTPSDSEDATAWNLQFGPATLQLDFEAPLGKDENDEHLRFLLQEQARQQLVGAGIEARISLGESRSRSHESVLEDARRTLEDVTAYFEILEHRGIVDAAIPAGLDALRSRRDSIAAQIDFFDGDDLDSFATHQEVTDIRDSATQLHADLRDVIWSNRESLYAATRPQNERLHFAAGFSTDASLPDELPKYAVFGINTFRHGPARLRDRDDVEDSFAGQMRAYEELMAEFDEFGGEAMFIGEPGTTVDGPEDMTWNTAFTPDRRNSFWHDNFNSQRVRDSWAEWAQQVAPVLADIDNLRLVQLGNEPFWSLGVAEHVGYNPPEVGCSTETWVNHVLDQYDSGEEWLSAITDWKQDVWNELPDFKRERYYTDGSPDSIVPWDSLEEAEFDPDNISGYDFIDFLQERHGDLATLNEAWFGDDTDRYYDTWEAVFPPVPTETGVAAESDSLGAVPDSWDSPEQGVRPKEKHVPAHVDWRAMAGNYARDSHTEFAQHLEDAGLTDPLITTNAVMGHYINDFNFSASVCGCYPWITEDGLDALGIDFYTIAYLQAYIASLRDSHVNRDEPERPVWVHEIRWDGNRNKEGAHIAMFTFAHGADGTVFFDHDRDFFPRDTVGLAKAMHAMADEQLQFETDPVSDGVAVLYSLDSLWVTDGLTGAGRQFMKQFQSSVATLDRMQVLYSVYSDRNLEGGVPDDVSVLMAPGARAMTDDVHGAIRTFVEDGGTLITTPDFAESTRYDRLRPAAERQWFRTSDDVVVLEGEDLDAWLENWQRGQYQMQRALGWADKPFPAVAPDIEPVIQKRAPRSVRYLDGDGTMDARKAGARRAADGTLFAFVDPWAENVTVAAPGQFSSARNLFPEESVRLRTQDGEGRVTVESGPAIVRFDP